MYRLSGVDPEVEMEWAQLCIAFIVFSTYFSVHVSPFSAQHVSFLVLRLSTGWHAR